MIALLKSEWRKLFTVRATYVLMAIVTLFVCFGSFYIEGYNGSRTLLDAHKLTAAVINAVPLIAQFTAIICLLLLANEYRYNTIFYTLSAANSRSKVLLAKFLTALGFAFILGLFWLFLSLGLTKLGLSIKHITLPAQDFNLIVTFGKGLFVISGISMMALLFAALVRNITGAFALLFLVPGPIEALLAVFLKRKAEYLPFTSLYRVVGQSAGPPGSPAISPGKSALIFLAYLTIGWLVAWYLFMRRDAN